ncbi:MAG: AgmX/PglI C-terminal domain-containing protein [Candidatus Latescibacterota bacterium]
MSLRVRKKIIISGILVLSLLVIGSCFLYPPEIRYSSYLSPNLSDKDPLKSIDKDTGSLIYDLGGSNISVRYVKEPELNALFPEESKNGEYSTNPFTYGNWIDPNIGYTPNRFTVFNVTITNRTFPKMRLDPTTAIITTDTGEVFHSYTVNIASAKFGKCFEEYYRRLLGQSGNEFYRYEMRLGMVRGKSYGLDETIFRGDSYSGLLTFDPLPPEVKRGTLILNDVVFRFDAFNRPADSKTISINFDRNIDKIEVTREMRMKELEREKVRVKLTDPSQLVNARINDAARNNRAINQAIQASQPQMGKCFLERYRRGQVNPGRMSVSFTIEPSGIVSKQNVVEVTGINSESFMNCVLDVIKNMKFDKIADMPTTGTDLVKGPALPVNVLYPLDFTIYVEETK